MVGWLDIALAVILLVTFVTGLIKGLVRELVGVVAAAAGFLLAARWYGKAAAALGSLIHNPAVAKFLGFVLVFLAVVVLGALVAAVLSKLMAGPLKLANHLLGGVFGFVEGMLICGAFVFALLVFPVNRDALSASRLAPYCYGLTKVMVGLIPKSLKDEFASAYRDIVKRKAVDGTKI